MPIQKQEETFLLSPYLKLMKCMVDYKVLKSSLPLIWEVGITTLVYQKTQKQKLLFLPLLINTSLKQCLFGLA